MQATHPLLSPFFVDGRIDYVAIGRMVKERIIKIRRDAVEKDIHLTYKGVIIDDNYMHDVDNFFLQNMSDEAVGRITVRSMDADLLKANGWLPGSKHHGYRQEEPRELFPHRVYTIALYETRRAFGDDSIILNGSLHDEDPTKHRNRTGRFVIRTEEALAVHRAAANKVCLQLLSA